MSERCPDCERPVGNRSGQCPARLLGAVDADHHACARVTVLGLRSQLRASEAEVARLTRELEYVRKLDKWSDWEMYPGPRQDNRGVSYCVARDVSYEGATPALARRAAVEYLEKESKDD